MPSGRRTFGFGIIIGVAAGAALLLVAWFALNLSPGLFSPATPTATIPPTLTLAPTPTRPPTATPTFTPIPTSLIPTNIAAGLDLSVTPTPDVVGLMITNGDLVFNGPLTAEDQARIYRASLTYAQKTVADSKRVSKEINGVGYGDPSNICGPLAIAILRDAGVLAPEVKPHDFWLLDPTKVIDQRILAAAFPISRFVHLIDTTAINKVNWTATPLLPGDFVFIWHGSWGNFDHMLVVNRVDSKGRAFAVTNFGTPDGYLIAETMLYDPNDSKAGIFYTWTKERDQVLGSTGFGGFEIWRARGE